MRKLQTEKTIQFYSDHLYNDILPFWFKNAIDYEDGGYYTCFDNAGESLISTDKYTWSQGRFIWVLSKLAEINSEKRDRYLGLAKLGVDFLKKYCFLENGNCAFLLTKTGEPKETICGAGYDISSSADCFVIMGFSKYAEMTGDQKILNLALCLYDSIIKRIDGKNFKTEPHPVPKGYKAHSIPMITLNTSQVLAQALESFNHPRLSEIKENCSFCIRKIMENFVKQGIILEMIGEDNKPVNSILGSYVNPGHTLEDMWFVMHYAQQIKDKNLIEKAVELAENSFKLGWDKEYGGLFQYVSKEGGKPTGDVSGIESSKMVKKLKNNWDIKLWWPHSEALYTFLLGYKLTGKESLFETYHKIHEYTFKVFPNSNKEVGEWIQIRDRKGNPVQKIVALPVKDPYHITRNLILIIELLSRC